MRNALFALFFALVSSAASADGWTEQGGNVYGSGGVSSPGFVNFTGSTGFQGQAFTAQGISQTFGNFSVSGSAFVPQDAAGGFASAFGNVIGGAAASHSGQFGNFNSNWMSSTAGASAGNGGHANVNVNGSTSSQSQTFVPPVPAPTPVPGGGKG